MTNQKNAKSTWMNAFLPLGGAQDNSWAPVGGGVLMLDGQLAWLVTAREIIETLGGHPVSTWVPREQAPVLLDLTESQQQSGLDWIHHPAGLSATLFPMDPSFQLKAFAETQCTRVRDLQPLLPAVTLGCMYGNDLEPAPHPTVAVCDGIVSSVNPTTGTIYSTAPLLPRNTGAPLLLASPYGDTVSLAGIVMGKASLIESDPREVPVRLSRSLCVDAAWELLRSDAATQCRKRIESSGGEPEAQG